VDGDFFTTSSATSIYDYRTFNEVGIVRLGFQLHVTFFTWDDRFVLFTLWASTREGGTSEDLHLMRGHDDTANHLLSEAVLGPKAIYSVLQRVFQELMGMNRATLDPSGGRQRMHRAELEIESGLEDQMAQAE
jgi:hypothetical protein